jgi:hypothetical protein
LSPSSFHCACSRLFIRHPVACRRIIFTLSKLSKIYVLATRNL